MPKCYAEMFMAKDIYEPSQAVEINPYSPQANYQLGFEYLKQGNIEKAKFQFQKCIEIDVKYIDAWLALANIDINEKDINACQQKCEMVIKIAPDNPIAYNILGNSYLAQRDVRKAEVQFKKAIEIAPTFCDAYLNLANLYNFQNRKIEAIDEYKKLIKLEPENIGYYLNLGSIYLNISSYQQANEQFEKIIEISPHNPIGYDYLGIAFLAMKDTQNALLQFKQAIEVEPRYISGYEHIGDVYFQQKMSKEAAEIYQTALDKQDISNFSRDNIFKARLHLKLAISLEANEDYKRAISSYKKAITLNPESIDAYNNLAYLYASKKTNLKEAFKLAKKAKELQPHNSAVLDTLGWVCFQSNNYKQAVLNLKEACNLNPKQPTIRYHIGMAYFMNGQLPEALKELERVLELSTNFKDEEEIKITIEKIKSKLR